jgi:hypothetical protein
VLRFLKYFSDIVSEGSDQEIKKKKEKKKRERKRVEGSRASSMDGIQIDKRSTLPESNKRNEGKKKAIVVGGRENKRRKKKIKNTKRFICVFL